MKKDNFKNITLKEAIIVSCENILEDTKSLISSEISEFITKSDEIYNYFLIIGRNDNSEDAIKIRESAEQILEIVENIFYRKY
jgi:hypothetical protein